MAGGAQWSTSPPCLGDTAPAQRGQDVVTDPPRAAAGSVVAPRSVPAPRWGSVWVWSCPGWPTGADTMLPCLWGAGQGHTQSGVPAAAAAAEWLHSDSAARPAQSELCSGFPPSTRHLPSALGCHGTRQQHHAGVQELQRFLQCRKHSQRASSPDCSEAALSPAAIPQPVENSRDCPRPSVS